MTSLSDVQTALAAYGAETDAALAAAAAQHQADAATIASLQQQLAPYLPSLVPVSNFAVNAGRVGVMIPPTVGRSTDLDGWVMQPMTSTHAADVPTAQGSTNPLFAAQTPSGLRGQRWAHFRVDARGNQGHDFHGFRGYQLYGCTFEDLLILGAYGSGPGNPEETFALPLYACAGHTLTGVKVDGNGTAASGIGTSHAVGDMLVTDTSVVGCKAWGMTSWSQLAGTLTTRQLSLSAGRGLNHELVDIPNVSHTGLEVHLLGSPYGGDKRHTTIETNLRDVASTWEFQINAFSGGLNGPNQPSPFVCDIGLNYGGKPNPTRKPPTFYDAGGNLMLVADQGNPKLGVPASNLDKLHAANPADLAHWVYIQRGNYS